MSSIILYVMCEVVSHLNPELTDSLNLGGQLVPETPCLHIQSTGITDGVIMPAGLYLGTGDPNSGPHTCLASALHTEPSHKPRKCLWHLLIYSEIVHYFSSSK